MFEAQGICFYGSEIILYHNVLDKYTACLSVLIELDIRELHITLWVMKSQYESHTEENEGKCDDLSGLGNKWGLQDQRQNKLSKHHTLIDKVVV